MAFSILVAMLALAGGSLAAPATPPETLAVYATEQSTGSMSVGGKQAYTKTAAVLVVNLSGKAIDLAIFCLKYDASPPSGLHAGYGG